MKESVVVVNRECELIASFQLKDFDESARTEDLRNERSECEKMAESVRSRLTNPWLYIPTNVVVWILLWISIDTLLGDSSVISAAIPGAAGRLAFGVFTYYFNCCDSIHG